MSEDQPWTGDTADRLREAAKEVEHVALKDLDLARVSEFTATLEGLLKEPGEPLRKVRVRQRVRFGWRGCGCHSPSDKAPDEVMLGFVE